MEGVPLIRSVGMRIHDVVQNAHRWHDSRDDSDRRSPMAGTYASVPKKATNVSLAEGLLTEAKDLGINISQAAEAGLAKAVSEARAARWQEENAEAIAYYNDYIEKNGLPLDAYRMF